MRRELPHGRYSQCRGAIPGDHLPEIPGPDVQVHDTVTWQCDVPEDEGILECTVSRNKQVIDRLLVPGRNTTPAETHGSGHTAVTGNHLQGIPSTCAASRVRGTWS